MINPPDVVGIGYVAVDRVFVDGLPAGVYLGGTCGNVLYVLAALGRSVAPVAELGDDPAARILVEALGSRGARTEHLTRTKGLATPSVIENLDTGARRHSFSFVDPDTGEKLRRWHVPTRGDVDAAMPALRACRVLFVDRMSDLVLEAMREAHAAGATVVFEPQEIGDPDRFREALRHVDVLKCSRERMGEIVGTKAIREDLLVVATGGEAGLDVYRHIRRVGVPARRADVLVDACGSGDMTTAGLIDGLLALGRRPTSIEDLLPGLVAGRNLASACCGHVGALGLVRFLDADEIRHVMREGTTRRVSPMVAERTSYDDPATTTEAILEAEAEEIRRHLDGEDDRPSRPRLARAREAMVAVRTRLEADGSGCGAPALPLGDATRPVKVWITDDELVVRLRGGTKLSVPLWWYPKLLAADESQRRNVWFSGDGIHWPDADEDVGIAALVSGRRSPGAVRPIDA